jgi:hypothetical protein
MRNYFIVGGRRDFHPFILCAGAVGERVVFHYFSMQAKGNAMSILETIIAVLFFPGVVFSVTAGLVLSWGAEKIPGMCAPDAKRPLLQPFKDFFRSSEASPVIELLPVALGFSFAVAASTILWRSMLFSGSGQEADFMGVLFLLIMPLTAPSVWAAVQRNGAGAGACKRTAVLLGAFEIPFVLACMVPLVQIHEWTIQGILKTEPAVTAPSGVIALLVALACAHFKTLYAKIEIDGPGSGPWEALVGAWQGPALGVLRCTRAVLVFALPAFLIGLFAGGISVTSGAGRAAAGAGEYIGVAAAMLLPRLVIPKMNYPSVIKILPPALTALSVLAIVLAMNGK